jgi:hypothetical protein
VILISRHNPNPNPTIGRCSSQIEILRHLSTDLNVSTLWSRLLDPYQVDSLIEIAWFLRIRWWTIVPDPQPPQSSAPFHINRNISPTSTSSLESLRGIIKITDVTRSDDQSVAIDIDSFFHPLRTPSRGSRKEGCGLKTSIGVAKPCIRRLLNKKQHGELEQEEKNFD